MARTNNIISYAVPNFRYTIDTVTSRHIYTPGFRVEDFNTAAVGSSDCNNYIPALAVINHDLLEFDDNKVIEYSMPVISGDYNFRQYDRLSMGLFNTNYVMKFMYKVANVPYTVYGHRGMLYNTEGKLLMCLAVETEYAFTIPVNQPNSQQYFDPNKYLLFITPEFDKPEYKNLRKKIEASYISNCKGHGIDIVYTTKVEQWLFKNNFISPTFKNVMELNKHLKEDVPKTLITV